MSLAFDYFQNQGKYVQTNYTPKTKVICTNCFFEHLVLLVLHFDCCQVLS